MNIESLLKNSKKLPESRRLVLNMLVTANSIQEQLMESLKEFELSPQQFNVLRILKGQKAKPANLSTIQERMVNRMSNTTRLVDKLVEKQLCERVICPSNRRKIEISITPKGIKLLEEINPVINRLEESIANKLDKKEVKHLNEKLNELRS